MQQPKAVHVTRQALNLDDYKHRQPQEADYSTLVEDSSLIYDAETGDLLIVYLQLTDDCSDVVRALRQVSFGQANAMGRGPKSRVFGNQPRSLPRRDNCTAAALAHENPQAHAVIAGYAERVSEYYKRYNPDLYTTHSDTTEKVLPDWRIGDSAFTSGIINFNNPLQYHFDAGNFSGVWSNMLVFREGTAGGYLACPDIDLGFALPNNSLLMFDGQGLLHGVTPIPLLHDEGYRYSIVYYSLKQMWQCLPLGEEIRRADRRRTERELRRAGLPIPESLADIAPKSEVRHIGEGRLARKDAGAKE